ncbi:MAG TPA: energy transducer TonB [Pyrinomonadaceae bacterium]|jgi:TonB family protein
MKKPYIILCLLAINSVSILVSAQKINISNKETNTSNQNTAKTVVDESHGNSTQPLAYNKISPTQYVRTLADKISQMQDVRASSYELAGIADLLWKRDETLARELFDRALEKSEVKPADSEGAVKLKGEIRKRVISLIAKRDAVWAENLIDEVIAKTKAEGESCENAEANLDIALDLISTDTKTAANFAERSLQNGISQNFTTFLQKLRRENPDAADRLFLQTLGQYTQQPNVDAYQLLVLGTYLFTSPLLQNEEVTAFVLTRFGNIGVPNITANRQWTSQNLVRTYLRAAVAVMLRPSSDPTQQQYKYALGSLLLPKAQQFAPELISVISAATASIASNVPSELTSEEAFTNLRRTSSATSAQKLENTEKMADQHSRDTSYLDITFHSWSKGDFATARTVAAKISDEEVQNKLNVLINFGEATAFLKRQRPNLIEIEQLASRLPEGLERAVLYLGIAAVVVKDKKTHAYANLQSAAKAARQIDGIHRPYLLLAIATNFASFDQVQADLFLNEALRAFNQLKSKDITLLKWEREVKIDPLKMRFPVATNTKLVFEDLVQKIATIPQAETALESLENELLRAKAFVALAKVAIDAKETSIPQDNEALVTVGEDGIRRSINKMVMPVYPEEARKKGIKGVAVIELQFDGKGDVTKTKILQSPDSTTGQSAIQALKQWKFTPSKLEGKPISVRGKITFYFVINAKGEGTVQNPRQYSK